MSKGEVVNGHHDGVGHSQQHREESSDEEMNEVVRHSFNFVATGAPPPALHKACRPGDLLPRGPWDLTARRKRRVCQYCQSPDHLWPKCYLVGKHLPPLLPQVIENRIAEDLCYYCGSSQHTRSNCWMSQTFLRPLSATETRRRHLKQLCMSCGQSNHYEDQCPMRAMWGRIGIIRNEIASQDLARLSSRGGRGDPFAAGDVWRRHDEVGCYNCGDPSHIKKFCPNPRRRRYESHALPYDPIIELLSQESKIVASGDVRVLKKKYQESHFGGSEDGRRLKTEEMEVTGDKAKTEHHSNAPDTISTGLSETSTKKTKDVGNGGQEQPHPSALEALIGPASSVKSTPVQQSRELEESDYDNTDDEDLQFQPKDDEELTTEQECLSKSSLARAPQADVVEDSNQTKGKDLKEDAGVRTLVADSSVQAGQSGKLKPAQPPSQDAATLLMQLAASDPAQLNALLGQMNINLALASAEPEALETVPPKSDLPRQEAKSLASVDRSIVEYELKAAKNAQGLSKGQTKVDEVIERIHKEGSGSKVDQRSEKTSPADTAPVKLDNEKQQVAPNADPQEDQPAPTDEAVATNGGHMRESGDPRGGDDSSRSRRDRRGHPARESAHGSERRRRDEREKAGHRGHHRSRDDRVREWGERSKMREGGGGRRRDYGYKEGNLFGPVRKDLRYSAERNWGNERY